MTLKIDRTGSEGVANRQRLSHVFLRWSGGREPLERVTALSGAAAVRFPAQAGKDPPPDSPVL